MIDKRLLGRWDSIPGTTEEAVTIEFADDGSLTYTIHAAHADQKIFLRCRTEDDVIVSDQPSEPREERTQYRFAQDGRLVMTYEGEETIYRRGAKT